MTLVVVTKEVDARRGARTRSPPGAVDLGENRAQDLAAKAAALAPLAGADVPRWHFIGRLQRNKVKSVAAAVALWQSVDRAELAAEIAARRAGRPRARAGQRDG